MIAAMAPQPLTVARPDVITRPSDPELEDGPPQVAHIVKVGPGESATAKVLEARVNGTPIEALCGFTWVPSRDPRSLPVCQACKEVYDLFRGFNDGLRDSPSD
jgi:hypothetical protein